MNFIFTLSVLKRIYMQTLTEANQTLQKQVDELKSSLQESVRQMEKTTDQYGRMKVISENATEIQCLLMKFIISRKL